MTPKNASDEIKKLLDELLHARTYEEKKTILNQINPFLEIIEAPIKKLKDEEEARKEKKRIIKNALRELISTLDEIAGKSLDLDPDVCEEMREVVHHCFIKPNRHYAWPAKFGMPSEIQEERIRAALQRFLAHPEVVAASRKLKTPEDRLLAFQDDVETPESSTPFSYFGHINKPLSRAEVEKIERKTQG